MKNIRQLDKAFFYYLDSVQLDSRVLLKNLQKVLFLVPVFFRLLGCSALPEIALQLCVTVRWVTGINTWPYCWDSDSFACPGLATYRYIIFSFFWRGKDNLFLVLLRMIIYLFFLLKPSKIKGYFYLTVFLARWRYNQAKEHRRTFMEPCNIWGWKNS